VAPFAVGLIVGLALGMIVIGFLAVAAYQRGFEDASGKRRVWRAELVARRAAVRTVAATPLKKAS
jgi:predicted membrane chloride channel (bestrophin family)